MTAELILYTNPMSRGRIARWMMEELGQPYRVEYLDYGTTMKAPEYLAINPMGKVPALRHGDVVVTEGAAICAYLADAFPEAGLMPPPGSPDRAAYYRWLFFAAGPVEAAITAKTFGLLAPATRHAASATAATRRRSTRWRPPSRASASSPVTASARPTSMSARRSASVSSSRRSSPGRPLPTIGRGSARVRPIVAPMRSTTPRCRVRTTER